MLYIAKIRLNENTVSDVVLFCKMNVDGKEQIFDFAGMLADPRVLPYMHQYGESVRVDAPIAHLTGKVEDASIYPVVAPGNAAPVANFSQLFEYFKQFANNEFSDEMLKKVGDTLKVGFEDVKRFKLCCDAFRRYEAGEIKLKITAPETMYLNVATTMQAVKYHNAKLGHVFQHINSSINKTHFMNTPSDTFFIEIPEYDKLRSQETSISSKIPKITDIAVTYPHPIYNMPSYKIIFNQSPSQRLETLENANEIIPLTDEQLRDVPRIDFALVEGSHENDELEIQPNEEQYYNALIEYIKYDIKQLHGEENIEENFKQRKCSSSMMEYLNGLIERMAVMNWSHTARFPLRYLEMDYDENSDDEAEQDEMAGGSEFLIMGDYIPMDEFAFLHEFINDAAESGLGLAAYVEAIIKIGRWGNRKPRILKIGDYPRYFDLNNFQTRNVIGNLSNLKPVLVDGYEFDLGGVIQFEDKFRDIKYKQKFGLDVSRIAAPVGFICKRYFENGAQQVVYFSMFDVIHVIKNNPDQKLIRGISYNNGAFHVNVSDNIIDSYLSLRLINESVNKSTDSTVVYYESDDIRSIVLKFASPGIQPLSVLSEFLYSDVLSSWYEMFKFSNINEFETKLRENPAPREVFVKTNIGWNIVKVVLKASLEYEEKSLDAMNEANKLAATLNIYDKLITQDNLDPLSNIWQESAASTAAPSAQTEVNKTAMERMQQMQAFQQAKADPKAETQPEVKVESNKPNGFKGMIVEDTGTARFTAVYANPGSKEIVGAFRSLETNGPRKIYLFDDPSKHEGKLAEGNVTITYLSALLFDALLYTAAGNPEDMQVRFASLDAIQYYKKYFVTLAKEGKG